MNLEKKTHTQKTPKNPGIRLNRTAIENGGKAKQKQRHLNSMLAVGSLHLPERSRPLTGSTV